MMRKDILLLSMAFVSINANAQQVTEEKYRLADEQQLWTLSSNAAGLAHDMKDSADNRGIAYFNVQHLSGDYHRVQEGDQQNQLRFFTERYQKIGRYLYGYGSFDFDMGRIKERAWSDVMRTYNSSPFISGSDVFGKYDFQDFTLNAKLASVRLGHWNFGASLYYKVGDLSRLRDPRPRARLLDYQITPAVTYTTGSHTIGLAAWYHRYKEKILQPVVKQKDPHIKYYTMTGVDAALGNIGDYAGYQREYVNHDFGGELSYGYLQEALGGVTMLTMHHGTEYVYGQYKYEPGTYYTYHYGLSTRWTLKGDRLLHSLSVSADYEQAYADQYKSQLVTEKDGAYTTQRWERIMTFKKRYQLKKLDLDVHYRLSFTNNDVLRAYAGARYQLQTSDNKRLLPTSQQQYGASLFTIEGGYGLWINRLWLHASGTYRAKGKTDLSLAYPDDYYAQSVLLPDQAFYAANWWQGRLELTYQQPLTIKGHLTNWFAKLYGSYLKTDNSLYSNTVGLSIGLYY